MPASGAVGATVTINGTNFGSTQGTSTMTFNGTAATTSGSWSATSIVATVPTGATTGNVIVNASGVNSNGVSFTVVAAPSITSVSPTSGSSAPVGDDYGDELRLDPRDRLGQLQLDDGNDDRELERHFDCGHSTDGSNHRKRDRQCQRSEQQRGFIHGSRGTEHHECVAYIGSSGRVGDDVAALTNFGSTQGTGSVSFNNVDGGNYHRKLERHIDRRHSTDGSNHGGNVIVNASGVNSNGSSFTVLPSISSLSPATGAIGAAITIAGSNFGSTQGTSTVSFNLGTTATTIGNWSATSIVANVPTGATTGNVVVNTSVGT